MLNNFIYAKYKSLFLEQLEAGTVPEDAVVFIADTQELWNHGVFYNAKDPDSKLSVLSKKPIQNKAVTEEINRIWKNICGNSFNSDFGKDFAITL